MRLFDQGNSINPESINNIVCQIENLFSSAAKRSFGYKSQTKSKKILQENKKWFNSECRSARNSYHIARKLYNKYKTTYYKEKLKSISKTYKQVLAKTVRSHKNSTILKLKNLKSAKPREFWKIINSINDNKQCKCPLEDLYEHFKRINTENENENYMNLNNENNGNKNNINNEINQHITESEIYTAVKNLKNNKSHGNDNILNEHIKTTIHVMAPIYVKLFNIIFDTGYVPDSWSLGDILPIFKNKGNIKHPENYRPITILSCFGKLFTSILNTRITKYVEENELLHSEQAGFRKGYSTTDNLFILQSLIDIAKSNKSKLFCTFIDFKQAFDTVWRNGLWEKLLNTNINGKCYNFITNMYKNIKSRVKTAEGMSAFFPCQTGVRQGENLSPLLFSIYLNDLRGYFNINQVPGVSCETDEEDIYVFLKIIVLLFADDTVIFGNTKENLQFALNVFEKYCDDWKLTVNISKTKVMIFSGGRVPKNLKFYFKGNELQIVNEYKYLGIFVTRTGTFFRTKKHIADQANIALFSLLRKIRALNLPIHMQIELFNKTIKPILLYGCEIWGFGNLNQIEKVQLKFLKHILNLKKSTPSFMIYGELGIYPIEIDIKSRLVSFWTKLVKNENNSLSSNMYLIIHSLNEQRKLKTKWLDNIKNLIITNGYGNVWESPNEINTNWFKLSFKQKVKDQYTQNWNSLVEKSSSGLNYRIFKDTFEINQYFMTLSNYKCRILTAFRTRNHRLPIEIGRWSSIPLNQRICRLCNNGIGDEYHYVLTCDSLTTQRGQYIKPYFYRRPNTLKFHSLMNSKNETNLTKLCAFIGIIMKTVKQNTI